jgi:hypothetical protein
MFYLYVSSQIKFNVIPIKNTVSSLCIFQVRQAYYEDHLEEASKGRQGIPGKKEEGERASLSRH